MCKFDFPGQGSPERKSWSHTQTHISPECGKASLYTYSSRAIKGVFRFLHMFVQSCPAFCDPMNCSPPGSSVHVILQTRVLAWIAYPFYRGSS